MAKVPDEFLSAEIEIKADRLRDYFDGEGLGEKLEDALDQAQGDARVSGNEQYIIIKVLP